MSGDTIATLVDGQPGSVLPVDDRGLAYGDGLFETMAVISGRVRLFDRHLERLGTGCARLGLTCPDRETLSEEIDSLVRGAHRGVLKLIVTRGSGGRGYAVPAHPVMRRVLTFAGWPAGDASRYRTGIDVGLCRTRLGANRALAGLKTLGRLEQVLARREVDARGLDEGIVRDERDHVVEATAANLFVVNGGCVTTPSLDRCGVAGVMRAEVIARLAARGTGAIESVVRVANLETADEIFLTNAIAGVVPVRRFERHEKASFDIAKCLSAQLTGQGFERCG